MNQKTKMQLCIYYNSIVIIIICINIINFSSNIRYFQFGPNNNLIIISIIINTYKKYIVLLFYITGITIGENISQIIALPIINFNIYNPDKHFIDEFSKNNLEFYGNCMCFITNIKHIFFIFIRISQIDIALFSLIISQLCNFIIIKLLLKEKDFSSREKDLPSKDLPSKDFSNSILLKNQYYPPNNIV